ncbi:hypothetical protein Skr01_04330 [Sphaerisporangium krabiense]|uniref:Uncharacterized protein n=1 Tax=Sphaerisporangium krabiense TaxID=763782 RepID=A0A7W9DSX1_9ACTN|nr:hypothetical protein [Sphaerisporangium krabiense]MBB5628810.1 hypothetical protein [Sphaerisporangium krabiense]GII60348.1 hypothetical protein Skr01_04330 [Sphaerisporangium krabiense]
MARYRELYESAGQFFLPHFADDLDAFLTATARTGGSDAVRHLYGLRFSYPDDPLVTTTGLLGLKPPPDILIGTVPRTMLYDPLEDEHRAFLVPNLVTYQVDEGCMIIASAQFVRLVDEFAAVISSTTPGPDGRPMFNISPQLIIDGLASIISDRWMAESTPPTFGHGYLPEDIMANPMWTVMVTIASLACWSFLIHHELAHIELGHFDGAVSPADAGLSAAQELAADEWALRRCVEPFLSYMEAPLFKRGTARGTAGFCIGTVLKLIGFLTTLDARRPSALHTHPEPKARIEAAERLMAEEALRLESSDGLASAYFGTASAFHHMIGNRLPDLDRGDHP